MGISVFRPDEILGRVKLGASADMCQRGFWTGSGPDRGGRAPARTLDWFKLRAGYTAVILGNYRPFASSPSAYLAESRLRAARKF